MDSIIDETNFIYGAIVTILAAVFGKYWFLFAGFLLMNVIDWLTGWYVAYKNKKESSAIGAKGIFKKVFYWVVIGIAFYIGFAFVKMGAVIGIKLDFVQMIGWFVLASFLVNEIRSILENVISIDPRYVPEILIKGLKVTNELLKNAAEKVLPENNSNDNKKV